MHHKNCGSSAQCTGEDATGTGADIVDRGIVLTGGGALLDGFEEVISQRTGINTMTAENPACVVAEGTGRYAEVMEELGK